MDVQIITVYMNEYPHQLTVEIDGHPGETTLKVFTDHAIQKLVDWIPIEFEIDAASSPDPRVRAVQGEYIARIIWKTIQDQLGP